MGYTVLLKDQNNNTVEFDSESCLGEGSEVDLNNPLFAELVVTSNLHSFFQKVFGEDGLYCLYGKKAREVRGKLLNAVVTLGNNFNGDPWGRTAGNAGYYLNLLFKWTLEKPECTFTVF